MLPNQCDFVRMFVICVYEQRDGELEIEDVYLCTCMHRIFSCMCSFTVQLMSTRTRTQTFCHDPDTRFTLYTRELTPVLSQQDRANLTSCARNATLLPQESGSTVYCSERERVGGSSLFHSKTNGQTGLKAQQ